MFYLARLVTYQLTNLTDAIRPHGREKGLLVSSIRSQNIFVFHNIGLKCIAKKECGFWMIRGGSRAKGVLLA